MDIYVPGENFEYIKSVNFWAFGRHSAEGLGEAVLQRWITVFGVLLPEGDEYSRNENLQGPHFVLRKRIVLPGLEI